MEMKERQQIQTKTNDFVINFPSLGLRQIIWLLSWLPLASDKISNISASRQWFSEVNMMVKGEKRLWRASFGHEAFSWTFNFGVPTHLAERSKDKDEDTQQLINFQLTTSSGAFLDHFCSIHLPPPKIKKKNLLQRPYGYFSKAEGTLATIS